VLLLLRCRYKHMPEVKRIVRHRHVPVAIHKVRRCCSSRVGVGLATCSYSALPVCSVAPDSVKSLHC
jgi:hypothetical protein